MSWKRILFAVQAPGQVDEAVLGRLAALAGAPGRELILFHALHDPAIDQRRHFGSRGRAADIELLVGLWRERLELTAQSLRRRGVRVLVSVRWDRPPHEAVVRQARRHRADLVVAQSTRRGRADRWLFTHTDFRLIEQCPLPLLLLRPGPPWRQPRILAAVDPSHAHAKPAQLDAAIVDGAAQLAQLLDGRVQVVHVTPPPRPVAPQGAGHPLPSDAALAAEEDWLAALRAPVVALARGAALPGSVARVEPGFVEDVLPRLVADEGHNVIAMGAVSRSVLARAFIGHTAERLLDRLACDVLVLKAPVPRARQEKTLQRAPSR
jgi:universal stress protein E